MPSGYDGKRKRASTSCFYRQFIFHFVLHGQEVNERSLPSQGHLNNSPTRSFTCRVRPQDGDIVKINGLSQGGFQVWPHNCPHLRALPIVKHESNVTMNLKICK